jgi:hypothetical protein
MHQIIVGSFVGPEEFLFSVVFDWDRGDGVGVVDIEDDKISIAAVGCDREAACLVGEEMPDDFVGLH